jgi:hypothetical protein
MPLTFPTGNINDRQGASNPLNALESNGYNVSSFTYPIDLTADPGENHMVVFYINESINTQFQTVSSNGAVNNKRNDFTGKVSPVSISPSNTGTVVPGTQLGSNEPAKATINSQDNTTTANFRPISRVATTIALYIPPMVQTSYQTSWDTVEFGAAGGVAKAMMNKGGPDILRALGEVGIGSMAGLVESGKDAAKSKLGMNLELEAGVSFGTRAVRNPNTEMLFRSIGFREYQFDFKFTPRSEQEAKAVQNIIKAFKFYSAPEIRVGANTPRFYIWPAEFDIEFWSNGKLNSFINKISTCACVDVTVDYTGAGEWSALRPGDINGMGVQTNLLLKFKELEIITKNRILQGF